MSGSPLTLEERYLIQSGLVAHLPFAVIGRQLGRHRSVIYDEYHRGCDATGQVLSPTEPKSIATRPVPAVRVMPLASRLSNGNRSDSC
jgi:IS30 family transposase